MLQFSQVWSNYEWHADRSIFWLHDMTWHSSSSMIWVQGKHGVWQSRAHRMPRWQQDWTLRADRAMPTADLSRREAAATSPTHLRHTPPGPTMTTTVAAATITGTATSTAPPSSPSPILVSPYPPCSPLSSSLRIFSSHLSNLKTTRPPIQVRSAEIKCVCVDSLDDEYIGLSTRVDFWIVE